jgi:hypothetical protein
MDDLDFRFGEVMMIKRRSVIVGLSCVALIPECKVGFAEALPHQGQTLILRTVPALILRIDPMFKPAPAMKIPIESLTIADRRVFVDASVKSVIRRLVIVQYETVRSGANFKFLYPPKPPADLGGMTYRFGAYVYDDQTAAEKAPAKEAGLTRALLQTQGYKVPRFFRVARLARVSDPAGRSEVIVFYMENADAEFPTGILTGADPDGDLTLTPTAAQAILARLKSNVTASDGP